MKARQAEQIALYEYKAAWCDAHGFPVDAKAHRAYVTQLHRSAPAANTLLALEQVVPPLRGCALCMHCACPTVREVHGLQPVRVVRSAATACGPGAVHMEMTAWSAA